VVLPTSNAEGIRIQLIQSNNSWGVSMKDKPIQRSSDELIRLLQHYGATHNRIPTAWDAGHGPDLPSCQVYSRKFGSWRKALLLAGFLPERREKGETRIEKCLQCGVEVKIRACDYQKSKTKHFFCTKNCAAEYNNAHKKYGIRRSKLEQYIEKQLCIDFPQLQFDFNKTSLIDAELDIYCPQLRLAIELNGIVHYEPIYGETTFEKTQKRDLQKTLNCAKLGIELAVIDTSKHSYITSKTCATYYALVKNLIDRVLPRLDSKEKYSQ
jgi:very-short-patch-repair endonuclease